MFGVAWSGTLKECLKYSTTIRVDHIHNSFVPRRQFSTNGKLELHSWVSVIPHPEKKHKGGEDAYFIGSDGCALGVADGVGGWADSGVDPSLYSRALMLSASDFYHKKKEQQAPINPVEIIDHAHKCSQKITGSATACVLVFEEPTKILRTANVGDSGFLLIRDGGVVYQSETQQSRFNCPYQLGTGSDNTAKDASVKDLEVKEGDIIVVATDGLFDNVFVEDIVSVVTKAIPAEPIKGSDSLKNNVAEIIASHAHSLAATRKKTPFEVAARNAGYSFRGGKMDDITVIVSLVIRSHIPQSKL